MTNERTPEVGTDGMLPRSCVVCPHCKSQCIPPAEPRVWRGVRRCPSCLRAVTKEDPPRVADLDYVLTHYNDCIDDRPPDRGMP